MVYEKLSNQQLQQFKYPNLIAELIESGYSICTCGEHMGLGRRQENDREILDKLTGKEPILFSEGFGLTRLFGAKVDYLFAADLLAIDEKPYAYFRWYEKNKGLKEECQLREELNLIQFELTQKPYLLEFIKAIKDCDETECGEMLKEFQKSHIA